MTSAKIENVLICSGFTETELKSFRENQYPRVLEKYTDWNIVIFTSNQSYIWKHNRAGRAQTSPHKYDAEIERSGRIRIVRKTPLIRFSDFLILPIPFKLIRQADVVHLIEFRQGNSVLIAAAARLLGKPVLYDHEQRGDRHYTLLHTIDSAIRRILIGIGSLFVDKVRHTVIENKKHFKKNAWRKQLPMSLSPLAADDEQFFHEPTLRSEKRRALGIADDETLVIIPGKIDATKRTVDAARACLDAGLKVMVVGSIANDVVVALNDLKSRGLVTSEQVGSIELNALFNAADAVLFTTFSVSYWEALATGAKLIAPRTEFSAEYIGEEDALLYGDESLFSVVEEQYKASADVYSAVSSAINRNLPKINPARQSNKKYTWDQSARNLISDYESLVRG